MAAEAGMKLAPMDEEGEEGLNDEAAETVADEESLEADEVAESHEEMDVDTDSAGEGFSEKPTESTT
jgi:hypothetical protein